MNKQNFLSAHPSVIASAAKQSRQAIIACCRLLRCARNDGCRFISAAIIALCCITSANAASISDKFTAVPSQEMDLSALNIDGNLVIVHFFAEFCPKCHAEMEMLEGFVGKLNDSGVTIISMPADFNDQETLKKYREEHGITNLKFVIGPALDLMANTGLKSVPATLFFKKDAAGYKLIGKAKGPIEWDVKEFAEWKEKHVKNCK